MFIPRQSPVDSVLLLYEMYLKVIKCTATLNLVILYNDAISTYKIDFKDSWISIIVVLADTVNLVKKCITRISVGNNMICVTE